MVCLVALDVGVCCVPTGEQLQPRRAASPLLTSTPTRSLKQCHKHTLNSTKDTQRWFGNFIGNSSMSLVIIGCSPNNPPFPHWACPGVSGHLFQLRQLLRLESLSFYLDALLCNVLKQIVNLVQKCQVRHRTGELEKLNST